jgi:uncharacterized membrane protein YphA (DoxX/SURF4 family)
VLVNLASQQIAGASALLIGVVLLSAGVPKAVAPVTFAGQIADYGVVPEAVTRFLARMVSYLELLTGTMLIAGLATSLPLRQIGAGLAALLFVAFLGALASAHARGRNIACACFGGSGELETVGPHSLVRTALLLVLAVVAMLPTHGERLLGVVGFAVILAALVAIVSELTRLLGPLRRATGSILEQLNAATAAADNAEVTQ